MNIAVSHAAFARKLAMKYAGALNDPAIDVDDLQQVALLSMLNQSKAYDPSRGSFMTFCRTWVERELRAAVTKQNGMGFSVKAWGKGRKAPIRVGVETL